MIFTARKFDFGRLFETIGEDDNGEPVMTDIILKTHTQLASGGSIDLLLLSTPETNARKVKHVLASLKEDELERELQDTKQDSYLAGLTWRHPLGSGGYLENRFYARESDKTSREGEAFHNSMPMDLPPSQVPVLEIHGGCAHCRPQPGHQHPAGR